MQKYKVFLNEKRILFCASGEITISKPTNSYPDFSDTFELRKWLSEFSAGKLQEVVFVTEDPQQAFFDFRAALTEIKAAGGVVRRDGQILFIFRNGKWDLPKGKIDKGETTKQAALREVEEECGIEGHRIIKDLPTSYHIYQSPYKKTKGEWIVKPTFWFEMEYNGVNEGEPQVEEGISELKWVSIKKLDEVLENTYENLKPLIQLYR